MDHRTKCEIKPTQNLKNIEENIWDLGLLTQRFLRYNIKSMISKKILIIVLNQN